MHFAVRARGERCKEDFWYEIAVKASRKREMGRHVLLVFNLCRILDWPILLDASGTLYHFGHVSLST